VRIESLVAVTLFSLILFLGFSFLADLTGSDAGPLWNLRLYVSLENTESKPVHVEGKLYLPSNGSWQRVLSSEKVEAQGRVTTRIVVDEDGDRALHFTAVLDEGERQEFTVLCKVRCFENPQSTPVRDLPTPKHLQADHFVQSTDPVILEKARELAGDEVEAMVIVQNVQRFVHEDVLYDLDPSPQPASEVLQRGRGACDEKVYLMVALLRALGLPCRVVGGYFIRAGGGGAADFTLYLIDGHAWVEVWLGEHWVPCDPTLYLNPGIDVNYIKTGTGSDPSEILGTVRSTADIRWSFTSSVLGPPSRFLKRAHRQMANIQIIACLSLLLIIDLIELRHKMGVRKDAFHRSTRGATPLSPRGLLPLPLNA